MFYCLLFVVHFFNQCHTELNWKGLQKPVTSGWFSFNIRISKLKEHKIKKIKYYL